MHNAHAKRLVCMSVDIYIYIYIYLGTKLVRFIYLLQNQDCKTYIFFKWRTKTDWIPSKTGRG